jgi:hypothetical protein
MELKSYEKAYLLSFKGAFVMFLGLISTLQIIGSIHVLYIIFILLISAIAVLSIISGYILKESKTRKWNIFSGLVNLAFAVYLLYEMRSSTQDHLWVIFYWLMFYAITEFVEAGIMFFNKNAFAVLMTINALLTLLFGYFFSIAISTLTPQGVLYIGLIALVVGATNILSSYLLSRK